MRLGRPLALTLLLSLSACGGSKPAAPGADAGCDPADPFCTGTACQLPSDCADTRTYDCVKGVCVPACTAKADCMTHPAFAGGPWKQGSIDCSGGLCVCDARKCVLSVCSADADCEAGEVCKAGACVAAESDPDACAVEPETVVLRKDQAVTFTATALRGGAPVRLGPDAFSWSVAAGDATFAKVGGAEVGSFKAAGATTGYRAGSVLAAVKSKPSVTCSPRVLVLDALSSGARVVVTDELTGRLVPGATVVFNGQPMTEEAGGGVHTLAQIPAAATPMVSVFHPGFGYVTLVGVTKTELLIPLRRIAGERGGGFQGRFTNLPQTDVAFGLAGASIPGNYTDLELGVLAGRLEPTDLAVAGQVVPQAPLPSASVLSIGGTPAKPTFAAWGVAGVCGVEDEVRDGACGTRTGFGLMGSVPLNALLPIFLDAQAGKPVSVGRVLAVAMPYLAGFKSAIVRDVSFKLKAVPADPKALYSDPAAFPAQDLTASMGLALRQTVIVPPLPSGAGARLDGAVVLAGAQVPGRGLVPLGMTAGMDASEECGASCVKDGTVAGIEVASENPLTLRYRDDGRLPLRMAPAHGGIEGSRYGVVALAIPTAGTLPNGALVTSALVSTAASLPNGGEVGFDPKGFLALPESGRYDFRSGEFSGLATVPEATVYRAVFSADANRRWTVYYPGTVTAFTLPKPPAGMEDPTISTRQLRDDPAAKDAPRAALAFWAMKAVDGGQAVDLDGLFDLGSGRAARLSDYLTAFSMYDAEPSVRFAAPAGTECEKDPKDARKCLVDATSGQTIYSVADGRYAFKLKVAALAVPAKAKVLLEASSGEKVLLTAMGEDWIATGSFDPPLAKDATGFHLLTATLVKPESADKDNVVPLDPKVAPAKLLVKVAQ